MRIVMPAGCQYEMLYNLGNFLRQAVLPQAVRHWTLTTLREKLIKIGAKVARHSAEDRLPDGGSGGSERVVPGHSGRDWAAEIGNGVVRMKKEPNNCMKTPETTEEVSSHPGEK